MHFVRAYALSAFKAEDLEDLEELRLAAGAVSAILDTEMGMHVAFCERWGISEPEMAALPEDPANMTYTRYVLERGPSGDSLDLATALAHASLVMQKQAYGLPKTRRLGKKITPTRNGSTVTPPTTIRKSPARMQRNSTGSCNAEVGGANRKFNPHIL